MKSIFNPTNFKLIDFTSGNEVNYHVNFAKVPDRYDPICEATYQIAPTQLNVGKVNISITSPSVLTAIIEASNDAFSFSSGYEIGFSDGFFTGSRKTFATPQSVTWSFLAGYEYGVQLGTFYKQYK